ncbi:hypothetical protein DL93DRAFT_2164249 [Clavulina sp. PMI_390]|nr:hypothetical protein DL93DRAFT_2164249 [Clavulina sp. PMI_390]
MSNPPPGVTSACCEPPAVVGSREDYDVKGEFKKFSIFDKAYVTGPTDTKKAIIFIYDIFGYWKTTQQGADILSKQANALVVMPDFAHGKPYDLNRYDNPPEGVTPGAEVKAHFFEPKFFQERVDEVVAVAKDLRKDGYTFVGCLGLCWGGRVCLTAGSVQPKVLDACASNHPAALAVEDGEKLQAPVALFPSKTDQIDVAETIYKTIKAKPFGAVSEFHAYTDMHHGWSGAHAYLEKEDNYKQFGDVYGRLGTFFTNASEATAA